MTISATSSAATPIYPTTTALTVLAQVSANATQLSNNREMTIISQQIQNQLNVKVAALQQTPDSAVANLQQSQITALTNQRAGITQISTVAGGNANILSDLQTQLASLQTTAAGGNAAGFDAALAAANTDIYDLTATAPPAPFQPDGISGLKGNGLGVGSSASYDLTTPAGQAAAANDVQAAQTLVGQVFQATTGNQLLATDLSASLSTQINTLISQQQSQQQSDQLAATAQILQLTQRAQDQTHLIELALGGTSTLANVISASNNPPQPYTSVFQALQAAVGATTTSGQQQPPAILSLFA